MPTIEDLLRQAYNAVDPAAPLQSGDPRYVNCNDVRGNSDAVQEMYDAITWSQKNTAILLTGHRGCGKSTELQRLKARLEQDKYCVLCFEADEDLDVNDVIYSDLLLAIARHIVTDLCGKHNIVLDKGLLDNVQEWFATTLLTKESKEQVEAELAAEAKLGIGLPAGVPFIARLLARFTGQIKTGHAIKEEIRLKIDPQLSSLIANINLLILEATAKLRKKGSKGLVLLIDNLDRVTLRMLDIGRSSHEALYIDHGQQLRSLACHVVYTIPISMIYTPTVTQLTSIFPERCVVPMIKVAERTGGDHATGLERLREMLQLRIPSMDDLFAPEAVDTLLKASGGHPRDLMRLARYSCTYANREEGRVAVDAAVVERAVGILVEDFSRMIPEEHYDKLARVNLLHRVENDAAHQLMLYNLSVLEYLNGKPPWHDVHPAVRRLPRFQEALAREQASGKGAARKKAR